MQIRAGYVAGLAVAVVDLRPVAGLLQDDHGGAVLRAGHDVILRAGAGADVQAVAGVDDDGLFVGRQGAGGAGDGDAGRGGAAAGGVIVAGGGDRPGGGGGAAPAIDDALRRLVPGGGSDGHLQQAVAAVDVGHGAVLVHNGHRGVAAAPLHGHVGGVGGGGDGIGLVGLEGELRPAQSDGVHRHGGLLLGGGGGAVNGREGGVPLAGAGPAGVGAALVVEDQGADVSKDDEHRRGDNGQGDDKAHQLHRVAAGVAHAGAARALVAEGAALIGDGIVLPALFAADHVVADEGLTLAGGLGVLHIITPGRGLLHRAVRLSQSSGGGFSFCHGVDSSVYPVIRSSDHTSLLYKDFTPPSTSSREI